MPKLEERAQQLRDQARGRLLEVVGSIYRDETVKPEDEISHLKPVYHVTRYISRTRETAVVDFLVIRLDTPVSISKDIALLLFADLPGYFVEGEQFSPGLVLYKKQPAEIIERLSQELYGRLCVECKSL